MLTVFGIFDKRDDAEKAISQLQKKGYDPKDISVIMREVEVEEGEPKIESKEAHVARDAAEGAVAGGVIGALAGILVGVGAIVVPGLGVLFIGGPIATTLGLTGVAATAVAAATTGVLAGGLVGALVGLGMPENQATVYEQKIKAGAILLAVPTKVNGEDEVRGILEDTGATEVSVADIKDQGED